ncbi:hypothetical protein CIHG_10514 [Coccidioides immitis H538.4]|uniref:Uncharacterized protein n=1 Tax=Coccidioides immitis H538.4 TaxID=396776 RepID=A0A0J8UXP9_COCIT|nr:hypothetical protein CIHG_10514 [Coccidioides immitis H538.4]
MNKSDLSISGVLEFPSKFGGVVGVGAWKNNLGCTATKEASKISSLTVR